MTVKGTSPPVMLLTIDVEDWFQVENLRPWFPPERWDEPALRVEANIHHLLDLFDGFAWPVKATFFVLGWIAERCPEMVRAIHQRGHEVGSHGYGHLLCNQLAPDALRADLQHSKQLLESIIGAPVVGYRAPNFSIDDDILGRIQACGYRYDASYNSFKLNKRYGRVANRQHKRAGIAWQINEHFHELPISNMELAGRTFPWGGGGWFRLLPTAVFHAGVRHILDRKGTYHFYFHPWEVDPGQPRVQEAKGLNAWRHYLNLHKTTGRLQQMIQRFRQCRFLTCRQYIGEVSRESCTAKPS